ncbi:hypothetical protein KIH27_17670 [Mycobacterium sp. M1]|uniref:PE domain-containing protein n=1 Tax=Mycolicibacter acidiphilus TaxID=2835306 RepID=A0ABS5RPI2_9MYCO|nr:hypothetical protein [Mycolicibacter acidiphilus]MBS9535416.1 hypothetical protein [Mycolicibacter acidiphilus]
MELAARPYAVATAALVAGGLMAAAPVVATLPGVQLRDVALTTGFSLGDIASQQLSQNSDLITGFLTSNGKLVADQAGQVDKLAEMLVGSDATGFQTHAAQQAVFQFFDANNALTNINQAALLGLLGARGTVDTDGAFTSTDLPNLNGSLIVDDNHTASFNFAGLEAAIGHYLGAAAFFQAAQSGINPEHGDSGDAFNQLVASVTTFNQALVAAEQNFNTDLLSDQVALEQAIFGNDSALNGIVNRGFNSFNMLFDAQQQSLNGFLGVTGYDPQELTSSLLQGSSEQTFNDGSIGGLQGMFDQNLAMLADIAGLKGDDFTDLFKSFDADAFSEASKSLFETLAGGPFGDVFGADGAFATLMTDLGNMFTTLG